MTVFRLLVTGPRHCTDAQALDVRQRLARVWMVSSLDYDHMIVVDGACPTGVDPIAHGWAQDTPGVTSERHPADWRYGRRAGPARNKLMVDLGADLCLGFLGPGSKGTWNCLQFAVDAGILTRAYSLPTPDQLEEP